MRILIDIGHPAHIHLFKHFANEMHIRNHKILFTCREKEIEKYLLKYYSFSYKSFGRKYNSLLGKTLGMIEFDAKEILSGYAFKPDIFLSHGSIYAAHASFILRKPHISFEDTFNFEQIRLYKPFTKVILTSDYDNPLKSKKVIRYSGYHELAYLHPKRFSPNIGILNDLGISDNSKYVIMRFGAWQASHDIGHKGISLKNKRIAIEEFSKYAKVFISSEAGLPDELEEHRIKIHPFKIHDAMAFASLLWAESFTMPAECSVLGTPSVIIHNSKSFPLIEQRDKYGLCFLYSESKEDQINAINKGIELLNTPNLKNEWLLRRNKMLSEKIDVTAFLVWFVENWPESFRVMKNNPDFQRNFL
jgi:predicted glycosyltransferase